MITKTFEPIRSLYAPDNGRAYAQRTILGYWIAHYGHWDWPSLSYWIVPGTWPKED